MLIMAMLSAATVALQLLTWLEESTGCWSSYDN